MTQTKFENQRIFGRYHIYLRKHALYFQSNMLECSEKLIPTTKITFCVKFNSRLKSFHAGKCSLTKSIKVNRLKTHFKFKL